MSRAASAMRLHARRARPGSSTAPRQVAARGRPRAPVSSRRMRTTSRRSSSCSDTMSLFSSTAGMGSTNRLAPEPEPPWMMPGICAAVLGLEQQHVAVVARGDELVLQQAVGVLAAQERLHHRLELRAQARRARGASRPAAARRRPPPRPRAGSRGGWRAARSLVSGTTDARQATSPGAPSDARDARGRSRTRPRRTRPRRAARAARGAGPPRAPRAGAPRCPAGRGRAGGPAPRRRRDAPRSSGRRRRPDGSGVSRGGREALERAPGPAAEPAWPRTQRPDRLELQRSESIARSRLLLGPSPVPSHGAAESQPMHRLERAKAVCELWRVGTR